MEEILPGLFHWTTYHPRIRQPVSSYYVADAAALLDPMVPEQGLDWFEDRNPPQRILLTNRHHYRGSDRFREAFGCSVHCHREGLHEFEGGPEVEGFEFGEQPAPGVTALEMGAICPEETALQIAVGPGVVAFADGLVNYPETGIGFVPDSLLGDDPEGVRESLLDSLRGVLDQDFDALLFAHGEPLVAGGREALTRFVGTR